MDNNYSIHYNSSDDPWPTFQTNSFICQTLMNKILKIELNQDKLEKQFCALQHSIDHQKPHKKRRLAYDLRYTDESQTEVNPLSKEMDALLKTEDDSSICKQEEAIITNSNNLQESKDMSNSESDRSSEYNSDSSENISERRSSSKDKEEKRKIRHIWSVYGNHIVKYALQNTNGDLRKRIGEYKTILRSKTGYSEAFEIKQTDDIQTKEFKTSFARLALNFIENKAGESFQGLKYRVQLRKNKNLVSEFIITLIENK